MNRSSRFVVAVTVAVALVVPAATVAAAPDPQTDAITFWTDSLVALWTSWIALPGPPGTAGSSESRSEAREALPADDPETASPTTANQPEPSEGEGAPWADPNG